MSARVRHWLSTPQSICIAFLVLFAIPLLTYTVHVLNYYNETTRVSENANNITYNIGQRLTESRTKLRSLAGLHRASEQLNDNELRLFSEELHNQSSSITSIARYERIKHNERTAYEDRMRKANLSEFSISKILKDGTVEKASNQQLYYPISTIAPGTAENLQLAGMDLGNLENLSGEIEIATTHNEPLIDILPSNWPLAGDLVLLQPIYLGNSILKSESSRAQESKGGFLLTINISALLTSVKPQIDSFDLTLSLASHGNSRNLYSQQGYSDHSYYLSSLYPTEETTEVWSAGDTSLIITLQHPIGYTGQSIIYFLAALTSLILISGLFTIYVVTSRRAQQIQHTSMNALLEEREKAENTLNSVQDSIIALDPDMRVVYINPAAVVQFNAKPSTTIGRPLSDIIQFQLVGETSSFFDVEAVLNNLVLHSKDEFDVAPVGRDHSDFILRLTMTNTTGRDDSISGHVLVLRDISYERRLTKQLAFQAHHDTLTGCRNRHYFEKNLADMIDVLPFSESTHALCYMDLDKFRVVNDTCGHRAGDQLLIELANNLSEILTKGDTLSRLGGDEFGLLMADVDKQQAMERVQRIYDYFQSYIFHHEENAFAIRASLGIVLIDQSCDNMKEILAFADIACYAAKDAGRNSMYLYSEEDDIMAERNVELSWLPRLQEALQNDQFRLHVQAMASIKSSSTQLRVSHFEFLLRLANPDGSDCAPWQFIQAAERYDLMREIDKWVIRNSLRTVAELKGGSASDCSFSINLSGQSAADASFKDFITEQIRYYDVDPGKIWFELTETAAISHFSVAVELIKSIRKLGCKVALDDFGSGLSSFGYLKNLPVDIIKIDGQFVRGVADNPVDREMVKAIHQVGRSMNIETVAEFVENQAVVDVLREIGVDYAQGYQIGHPCDIREAISQRPDFEQAA